MTVWIRTFPTDERLQDYLELLPEDIREDIQRSARGIFDAADSFLDAAARVGKVDLERFHCALEEHLKLRFPWMDSASFGALKGYTAWYSWHEGYSI